MIDTFSFKSSKWKTNNRYELQGFELTKLRYDISTNRL